MEGWIEAMITFYLICKKGSHENNTKEEVVNRFQMDISYREGLKILRGITHKFKDLVKLAKILGRA